MKLHIHPSLVRFTDSKHQHIQYEDRSLKSFFTRLFIDHPKLQVALMPNDVLSPYVNLYLNGEVILDLYSEKSLCDEDEVEIMTALVGG